RNTVSVCTEEGCAGTGSHAGIAAAEERRPVYPGRGGHDDETDWDVAGDVGNCADGIRFAGARFDCDLRAILDFRRVDEGATAAGGARNAGMAAGGGAEFDCGCGDRDPL